VRYFHEDQSMNA